MGRLLRKELKRGVRVVVEELEGLESVSIGICITAGARYENSQNYGIAHFIEHMLFKGTKNRTAKEIAQEIDNVGGRINATTGKESTLYYVKVLNKHFDLALSVLWDMLVNSIFDKAEIEREKNVVIEEIRRLEDTPEEAVHELITKAIWQDSELSEPVLGKAEIINKLQRDDLLDFINQHYITRNIIVSIAGNISADVVFDKVERLFEGYPIEGSPKKYVTPVVNKKNIKVSTKDLEQLHICLATPGLSRIDPRRYVLNVIDAILGGGMSSRLFQEVREKRGLAYAVGSYYCSFKDTGYFVAYAGTKPENYLQLIEVILTELFRLKSDYIKEEELNKAKNQIIGNFYLNLENTLNRMIYLAESELYFNRLVPIKEVIEGVLCVDKKNIIELSEELFRSEFINIAVIGPKTEKDCYIEL